MIIDSCELIGATSSSDHPNLLQHYANLLARGSEVGVHLIVTRNSINIGDALTTGFLGRLRAAGCATVVLGGDARDGELLPGIRSVPRPPRRGSYVRDGKVETIQVAHLPAK